MCIRDRSLIIDEMKYHDDSWDNVVSCTLTEEELCKSFNEDYGCSEGKPFTVWTKTRVYFPAVYDGAEWVESVSVIQMETQHSMLEEVDHFPNCPLGTHRVPFLLYNNFS